MRILIATLFWTFVFCDYSYSNPFSNFRHTLDLSVRTVKTGDNDPMQLAFLGFDLHRVISSSSEDRATLTLQPYVAFVRNGPSGWDSPPQKHPMFDGSNDWSMQWRNFNANIKIKQDGSLNLRLGHIEVPFGIEYPIDTNGRALDYAHGANFVGIKADWGVSLNGIKRGYEYEVALLRGSGNGYAGESVDRETPYFISGRLGASSNADFGVGLSALRGNLLTPSREIVERSRFALDSQYYYRNLGFLGEISVGRGYGGPLSDQADFLQLFSEMHWKSPKETSQVWLQLVHRSIDAEASREIRTGVAWVPIHKVTLSSRLTRKTHPKSENNILVQLRYRY